MQSPLPKPWPRPRKQCASTSQDLQSRPYYSALIDQDGHIQRVDVAYDVFEKWKKDQPNVLAWWKKQPLEKGRVQNASEHLVDVFHQVAEINSTTEPALVYFFARALQRLKLMQIELVGTQYRLSLLDGSEQPWYLDKNKAGVQLKGSLEKKWLEMRKALGF